MRNSTINQISQIQEKFFGLFIGIVMLGFDQSGFADPSLIETPSSNAPSIYARGVQFDPTNAFVAENSDAGLVFYTTHTAGQKWNNLIVLDGNKKVSWNWTNDLSIAYYNQGNAIFYYVNHYYDNNRRTYPFNESV